MPSRGVPSREARFQDRETVLPQVLHLLASHQRFLVTSHARPDGDAIGSSLAAMHLLESMGKRAAVPRTFAELPGASRIVREQPVQPMEVALVLECDSVGRTGFSSLHAPILINIDHHYSGVPFAEVNWIDPEASAVGAMIYELALATGLPISRELASCLYAAVLTDTIHFTSGSTTAATFGLAQHLVDLGASASEIAEAVYHSYRPARLWVLGSALRRLHIESPIAWSAVVLDEIEEAGAEVEDCEGIVNYVVGVEGVRAGMFLRELPGGQFRVSLRSKGNVDVATIAERYGGGGHRNASGCTLDGPLERATDQLTRALMAACSAMPLTRKA